MGFYHGTSQPPEGKEPPGGLKETFLIVLVVFRVLALPLGVIFGGVFALVVLFWLFTISGWAGLAALVAIGLALAGYGVWEYRHPPTIE